MERRVRLSLIIVISIIVSLPLLIPTFDTLINPLSWSIEEGDTFQFRVSQNWTRYDEYYHRTSIAYEFLVDTEIVDIPALQIFYNANGFFNHVIDHMKVVSTFSNGSSLPESTCDKVNIRISSAILPIGNWQKIRTLVNSYSNRINSYSIRCSLTIELDNIHLLYRASDEDRGFRWSANISLTTGIPMYIHYSSGEINVIDNTQSHYDLYISLVEI